MNPNELQAFLQSRPAFQSAEPQTIARIAAALERRELAAGESLFREDDPGSFVFIVESGDVEAQKLSDTGREVVLRALGSGEVGGLTSMAVGRERSAGVRARNPAVVLTIDSDRFRGILAERTDLGRSLLAFMGDKVRRKSSQLAALLARVEDDPRPSVAVFDTKPYDREHLSRAADDLNWHFFDARLGLQTVALAGGHRLVCAFVNDLSRPVLERLAAIGVELVALRCAGFKQRRPERGIQSRPECDPRSGLFAPRRG